MLKWNIENLREAAEDGDFQLYHELMKQLESNGVDRSTATFQCLRTLSEMSWSLVDTVEFFSNAIEDIYYDLKIETLKAILGSKTFAAIYEEE